MYEFLKEIHEEQEEQEQQSDDIEEKVRESEVETENDNIESSSLEYLDMVFIQHIVYQTSLKNKCVCHR